MTERYTDEQGRKAIIELQRRQNNGEGPLMSEGEATILWAIATDKQRLTIEKVHTAFKSQPTDEEQHANCLAEIDKFREDVIKNKGRSVYLVAFIPPDQVLTCGAGRGDDLSRAILHGATNFAAELQKVRDGFDG